MRSVVSTLLIHNPLIRRELYSRMRERKAFILPAIYLGILGAFMLLGYASESPGAEAPGRELFAIFAFTQLTLVLLVGPVFSAGAITLEREQNTLEALLASPLRPLQIVLGKLVASQAFVIMLIVLSLPLASSAFVLGGLSAGEVAAAYAVTVAATFFFATIGLLCSSYFQRSIYAGAVTYGLIGVVLVGTVLLAAFLSSPWGGSMPDDLAFAWPPLQVNPYLPMLGDLVIERSQPDLLLPPWLHAIAMSALGGTLFLLGTVRNLRRAGA